MKHARLMMILFVVLTLVIPGAGAESLFSLLATSTPVPAATPSPTATPSPAATNEPTAYTGGLFAQLETATPAPVQDTAPSASSLFFGLGYGDHAGKEADRTIEDKEKGTYTCIYEQVSEADFQGYGVFLEAKGCQAERQDADVEQAVAYLIYNSGMGFGFRLVYQADQQRLTLISLSEGEESSAQPTPTPAPTETPTAYDASRVCPDCDKGKCTVCRGRGYRDCGLCLGLGICGVCFGHPQTYIPGYGGVGTGSYVTCKGCNGSGRCTYCGGTGRQVCQWCDHGVCRTCHGDYMNYR